MSSRRAARRHPIEAGEVSDALLPELPAEIAEAHICPADERDALAIEELADRFGCTVDQLKNLLSTLEAQPAVTRELLLRRFVEARLKDQGEAYRAGEHGD